MRTRRPAVTLIELLVVLALILVLATLGYLLAPTLLDNQQRVGAVDQVSQALLIARQRARRDATPTGLRLLPEVDTAGKVVAQPDGSVLVVGGRDGTVQPADQFVDPGRRCTDGHVSRPFAPPLGRRATHADRSRRPARRASRR